MSTAGLDPAISAAHASPSLARRRKTNSSRRTSMIVRIRIAATAALVLFGALPAMAQDTSSHKPGGLNKVAHDVSNTVKKAGRDTKAEVRRDESKTHGALQKAGNDTKTEIKRTTGMKGSQAEHPGGLNKVARHESQASKKAGRSLKHEQDEAKRDIQGKLKETGKSLKDTTLKGKP